MNFTVYLSYAYKIQTDEKVRQIIEENPLQYETYSWNSYYGDAKFEIMKSQTDLTDVTPVPSRIYILFVILIRLLSCFEQSGLVKDLFNSKNLAIQILLHMKLDLEWTVGHAWITRYINFFYKE